MLVQCTSRQLQKHMTSLSCSWRYRFKHVFFPPASAVEGIKSVPSVCVSVSSLLAERFDLGPRNLVWRMTLIICRPSSKVIGQRSRSPHWKTWFLDDVSCADCADPFWHDIWHHVRLVHLKTGHFGEKILTSYVILFLITRTAAGPLWSSLVCDNLMVVHIFNLRHERASGSKYFQRSERLNHIMKTCRSSGF